MEVYKSCPEAFIVAERENMVVGYIMCRLEFGFSDLRRFRMVRKGHVVSVAVMPDFRRRGIGRELVVSAMKSLELHGGEECFLEVRTANDEAVKMYKDMGVYASSLLPLSFLSSSGWRSHLRGMFWLVPSGSARRMLMGKTPSSSSINAMSIGDRVGSFRSNSTGAPIET